MLKTIFLLLNSQNQERKKLIKTFSKIDINLWKIQKTKFKLKYALLIIQVNFETQTRPRRDRGETETRPRCDRDETETRPRFLEIFETEARPTQNLASSLSRPSLLTAWSEVLFIMKFSEQNLIIIKFVKAICKKVKKLINFCS